MACHHKTSPQPLAIDGCAGQTILNRSRCAQTIRRHLIGQRYRDDRELSLGENPTRQSQDTESWHVASQQHMRLE